VYANLDISNKCVLHHTLNKLNQATDFTKIISIARKLARLEVLTAAFLKV
jgi:hypothetical protein